MRINVPRTIRSCLGVLTLSILGACSGGGTTDTNASSRYRLTTEFTGSDQLLMAVRTEDGTYSLEFKPWINPYVEPFSNEVLDREWVIEFEESSYYRITNRGIGKGYSLDVINDGVFDRLTLAPSAFVSGQRWQITTLDNGFCRITSDFLGSGIALDITSDSDEPMLTMRAVGNYGGQHWRFSQIGMFGLLDSTCTGIERGE